MTRVMGGLVVGANRPISLGENFRPRGLPLSEQLVDLPLTAYRNSEYAPHCY